MARLIPTQNIEQKLTADTQMIPEQLDRPNCVSVSESPSMSWGTQVMVTTHHLLTGIHRGSISLLSKLH